MSSRPAFRCGGRKLSADRYPLIMGILNVTPDSFSDGGRFFDPHSAESRALAMIDHGADIIDIGGESTRPGATPVPIDKELGRVLPVIDALAGAVEVPLSIDTRRPTVAREALAAGCTIVNDVTACADPEMIEVLGGSDAGIVIMHMKGEPRSMQANPTYDDAVEEIRGFLVERAEMLEGAGIARDRIAIDPGIGFGKRFRDNLDLLSRVVRLADTGYPLMIGASRKRFLGELLDAELDERLPGSLAVAARCLECRVDMVRVHDVKETKGIFTVLDAMRHPTEYTADW